MMLFPQRGIMKWKFQDKDPAKVLQINDQRFFPDVEYDITPEVAAQLNSFLAAWQGGIEKQHKERLMFETFSYLSDQQTEAIVDRMKRAMEKEFGLDCSV